MIKIVPYYERSEQERNVILLLYLNMVAEVVPFLRSDVLVNLPVENDGKYRRRTKEYINFLKNSGVNMDVTPKEQDAHLARKIIKDYSNKLHEFLYEGIEEGSCHVNSQNLHQLLTLKMPHGLLPNDFSRFIKPKQKPDLLLKYVFRYEAFSKQQNIFRFLQALGVGVCPYCNRQYITTVATGKHRTRPQLDHFKNKKKYPFLALSINNLVPSCGVCNLMKHENDKKILYPYEDGMADLFSFSTEFSEGIITSLLTGAPCAPEDFRVVLKKGKYSDTNEVSEYAENSISEFALEALYQTHKKYITDLYFQRYIHTDKIMEDIISQFPILFSQRNNPESNEKIHLSPEEIKAAKEMLKCRLAPVDYRQEMWGNQPLSKLTHDILKEIDERMGVVTSHHKYN